MNHIKAIPSVILLATLLLGPTVLAMYVSDEGNGATHVRSEAPLSGS